MPAALPSSSKNHLRPSSASSGTPGRPFADPLVLWHLLSLDAPTVAGCWTAFTAWCCGVRIAAVDVAAMFVAVWMLYVADRILDAAPLFSAPLTPELRERHLFHHRHRNRLLPTAAVASLPLLVLLHFTVEPVLHLYVLLACLLGAWLLLVHARSAGPRNAHRLPKELAVGLFFPAATFIPTVARAPQLRSALLVQACAFGSLCMLNCLYVYRWEHAVSSACIDAHLTTRTGVRWARPLTLFVLCATLALALAPWLLPLSRLPQALRILPHGSAFLLCCAVSAALLGGLDLRSRYLSTLRLRALADLVLLTPLFVSPALRVAAGR